MQLDDFEEVIEVAKLGCERIADELESAVRSHAKPVA